MLNENVRKLLKENMWDLATCLDNEPNVVPVAFKDITEDGKLLVGNVFLETGRFGGRFVCVREAGFGWFRL